MNLRVNRVRLQHIEGDRLHSKESQEYPVRSVRPCNEVIQDHRGRVRRKSFFGH